jgi:hypothetical protein
LGSDSKVWNFTFDACSLSVMHPYRAEAERMRREEEKRRLEEAARKAEYERNAKAVKALAQQWQESKLLRAFTAALQSTATEAQLSGETKQRLKTMIDWSAKHADYVDPLTDLKWTLGGSLRTLPGTSGTE